MELKKSNGWLYNREYTRVVSVFTIQTPHISKPPLLIYIIFSIYLRDFILPFYFYFLNYT